MLSGAMRASPCWGIIDLHNYESGEPTRCDEHTSRQQSIVRSPYFYKKRPIVNVYEFNKSPRSAYIFFLFLVCREQFTSTFMELRLNLTTLKFTVIFLKVGFCLVSVYVERKTHQSGLFFSSMVVILNTGFKKRNSGESISRVARLVGIHGRRSVNLTLLVSTVHSHKYYKQVLQTLNIKCFSFTGNFETQQAHFSA